MLACFACEGLGLDPLTQCTVPIADSPIHILLGLGVPVVRAYDLYSRLFIRCRVFDVWQVQIYYSVLSAYRTEQLKTDYAVCLKCLINHIRGGRIKPPSYIPWLPDQKSLIRLTLVQKPINLPQKGDSLGQYVGFESQSQFNAANQIKLVTSRTSHKQHQYGRKACKAHSNSLCIKYIYVSMLRLTSQSNRHQNIQTIETLYNKIMPGKNLQ